MYQGSWGLFTHCIEGVLLKLVWKKGPHGLDGTALTLKHTSFYVWWFFLCGAQVIAYNRLHCQVSSGELPKPFNFPAPAGKWDLFRQPPCKRDVLTRLRAGGLPSAGGPWSPVLLPSRTAPMLPLGFYYLAVVCPLGSLGVPQLGCWGEVPPKPTLFSLMPVYVWITSTAQCLSSGHPYTCPTEPYGLALGFSSACAHAIPAQPCPAPSGHVVTCSLCLQPSSSTWPRAAICKIFGHFAASLLHAWEAAATSWDLLAFVNPEEQQHSFPALQRLFLKCRAWVGRPQWPKRPERCAGCPREGEAQVGTWPRCVLCAAVLIPPQLQTQHAHMACPQTYHMPPA